MERLLSVRYPNPPFRHFSRLLFHDTGVCGPQYTGLSSMSTSHMRLCTTFHTCFSYLNASPISYEEIPVLDWACVFLSKFSSSRRRYQPPDLERLNPEDLKLLKAALKGVRITVTVPAGGRRPARPIKDLWPDAGNYAFMKGDEETTIKVCSVIRLTQRLMQRLQDYYNEKYGFRLRFPRLFGIVVNVQQKTIVPVEICTIVGGQMYKKTLFPDQMSELLQHVTKNPRDRIQTIEQGVQGDVSLLTLTLNTVSIALVVPRLQKLSLFLSDRYAS